MADQLVLTSPGSSDTAMEGHPQPVKMAALNFGHQQDLAALDHMGINLQFPASRPHDRLALWYQRNDGPWTPPGLTSPQADIRNPSVLGSLRGSPLVFSNSYRESIVPSECDTVPPGAIPSDSGYGGSYGAKHSVANGSVCDESLDRNTETQSLIGHISELNFRSYSQDVVSKAGVSAGTPWSPLHPIALLSSSSSSVVDRQANFEGSRTCEICNKLLKTKSEFKKHKQRHDKPFKCDVENCTRREGFSTPNDLDRHKRSLHPDEKAAGNRYSCPVGACKNKDKIWPRADNFRAHMKRVHQRHLASDEDLDEFKLRPAHPSKEASDLAGDSAPPEFNQFNAFPIENTNSDSWGLSRSPVIELSTEPSPMEVSSQIQVDETSSLEDKPSDHRRSHLLNSASSHEVQPDIDDTLFSKQEGRPRPASAQSNTGLVSPGPTKPGHLERKSLSLRRQKFESKLANLGLLSHVKKNKVNESQDYPNSPSLEAVQSKTQLEVLATTAVEAHAQLSEPRNLELEGISPLTLDLSNRDKIFQLLEALQSRGVLEEFGYKKDVPAEPEETKQDPTSGTTNEPLHHEKRHLKPYGCTFSGCDKKFGSKNDWKRHENSQHFMLEHWRCDEKQADKPTEICGKVIHRRELFKQHLSTWHHIKEQPILEAKLETCRVGRNCEARFWCGFCRTIIEIENQGLQAWTERFNHIDDHFHGRSGQVKKEINDWQPEFPLQRRAESPTDDSENSSGTTATPASSTSGSNVRGHAELEKQHARIARPKRKRDDACDAPAVKRSVTMDEMPRFHLPMPRDHACDK
ncbi:hypothetical protein F4677DRAFT_441203 [Hypoxylon crocopeplum]|nr:hypothetical protein F4677DRAFT_441203 [Hypoxylon crocopeplum]